MKRILSTLCPEPVKSRLRPYLNRSHARRLAATSKRLDVCAAQLASVLHLAKHPPLKDKVCLEIGAGWVLSHALLCHLLGAKRVIAADIQPLAHPEYLSVAVRQSVSYILADILSPFEDYSNLRARVQNLLSIPHFNFDTLRSLGIEYLSPMDLATASLGETVDFVFSTSVLEHVPADDVPGLFGHLSEALAPGGTMIHCIHLEDHEDIDAKPFEFLSVPAEKYPRWRQTNTGNRIRASEWRRLFDGMKDCETEVLYAFKRTDVALPDCIHESVIYSDEMDLRTSHLGMFTRKRGVA